MNNHLGPQPPLEISHYDFAGVNCTQRRRMKLGTDWMETLRAEASSGAQAVCLDLFAQKTGHSRVRWGCEEINPREKPQRKTSETIPGKPRKKPQKEEGGHANRGDIHHQLLTYLDPLVFSTGDMPGHVDNGLWWVGVGCAICCYDRDYGG